MTKLRGRLSPSTLIATAALVAATGGTAVAAGEVITRPDQVANDVVEGRHIKDRAVSRSDLERPYFHVRVSKEGQLIGTGNDGTVQRLGTPTIPGTYDVRFVSGGKAGVAVDNCAITATPMGNEPERTVGIFRNPSNGPPGTVRFLWRTFKINNDGETFTSKLEDTAFDVIAVC